MATYTAWFSMDKSTESHGMQIKCNPQDIPRKLASIALPYFMDGQSRESVTAKISGGRKWMTYLIQLQKDTLSVYRLKAKFERKKEKSGNSPDAATPDAEEGES